MRPLDLALHGHDLVGALQNLCFVNGRLLEELGHPPRLLLHVPLQVEELRLRFSQLALDGGRLGVGQPDFLPVGHHQLGRNEELGDGIALGRRLLGEGGERKQQEEKQ